jgi:two-component system sensor histidine kinase HydH
MAFMVRFTQVFLNLTMNAIQAMPTGGSVDFSLEATPTLVRIRVADTGPGIPPDKLGRIFDPFVTSKPDGTGLGLAVSAQIVAAHRGQITVNSREPHGAEFVVELPVRQENHS